MSMFGSQLKNRMSSNSNSKTNKKLIKEFTSSTTCKETNGHHQSPSLILSQEQRYGESTNINEAIAKVSKVILAIKSKKLTSQISFTKTKDTPSKFKIIVVDDREDNIETIETQSFSAIKLNRGGISKDSTEYNLTCIITFAYTVPSEHREKTIKDLFQDSHVTFKDENLTHHENQSKFKEGVKYHHYSYLCENEDEVKTLTRTSIVVQHASKKSNKRFRKYSETNKNRTTYAPYPSTQPTNQGTFNFSVSNANESGNELTDLTTRVTRTEADIQIIKAYNQEIKASLNSVGDMMKQILQKLGISATAGGTMGSMDVNND